ncbi:MAG: hypothetical protein HEQ39_14805 [Rhizobacter sp.]
MHLLIPFASAASPPAQDVLRDLVLPHLAQLLKRLVPSGRLEGDEYSLTPPHERALADVWAWQGTDGCLPFAALAAQADGVVVGDLAWGLMTPVHWLVGRDNVTLTDPDALQLHEPESRAIFQAVRGLFDSEGFGLHWAAPTRWYLQHDSLANLPCASLDRALGRNVDLWLQASAATSQHTQAALRKLRLLQNEFQMLLYPHDITNQRDARGLLAVNSFWLSGCGRSQVQTSTERVEVNHMLRSSLLLDDWASWREAWLELDATVLAQLNQAAKQGDAVTLTLCGERNAQTWRTPAKRSFLDRLKSPFTTPNTATWLQAL